jgi:hypothetical protein
MANEKSKSNGTGGTGEADHLKESIARRITSIVLWGTVAFGIFGLLIAFVSIFFPDRDVSGAKEIMQILFSTILPLLGTWIGTVLAFYFSRENFIAANESVANLVDKLTSDKKLATIKAKDIMIGLNDLVYKEYPTGTDDSTLNLKTDFIDFINGSNPSNKKLSRIILLDENKVAKYVLHRSLIEGFVSDQFFEQATKEDAAAATSIFTVTFADMKASANERVQRVLANGVKFVREDGTLSDAKLLMKNTPECNDVFITKSGSPNEPVLGWITEKTIAEESIVD